MMNIDAADCAIVGLVLFGWYAAGRLLMASKLEPQHLAPLAKLASNTWRESAREILASWLLDRCHEDAAKITATLHARPWLRDMLNTEGHWVGIEHPRAREIAAKD